MGRVAELTILRSRCRFFDEDQKTTTSEEQISTEKLVDIEIRHGRVRKLPDEDSDSEEDVDDEGNRPEGNARKIDNEQISAAVLVLRRQNHLIYVRKRLKALSASYAGLDASRSWLCYWGVHSLALLGDQSIAEEGNETRKDVIRFLATCKSPDDDGGYTGGPGQISHLATTYAAVAALVELHAADQIDRDRIHRFLLSMRQPGGGYTIHQGGEVDVRAAYLALAVVRLLNLDDDRLTGGGLESWLRNCQTWEGGWSAETSRYGEAHGGYAFCAAAALALLGAKISPSYWRRALRWLTRRQMPFEGGFQGRTHKLVDACYSYWQSAALEIVSAALPDFGAKEPSYDARALQEYVLAACQDEPNGGLRDKPGRVSDLYHTCYALSGLALAQQRSLLAGEELVGGDENRLEATHPVLNVTLTADDWAVKTFGRA